MTLSGSSEEVETRPRISPNRTFQKVVKRFFWALFNGEAKIYAPRQISEAHQRVETVVLICGDKTELGIHILIKIYKG